MYSKFQRLSSSVSSVHLLQVTLLAHDFLLPLRAVARRNWILTRGAGAVPELARITESHATPMTFVGVYAWNRKLHLPIKI